VRKNFPWDQRDLGCPVLFVEIFLFSFDPNHFYILGRPVPHKGRLEIVTDAGQDAVDAGRALTNALISRTAKRCGPDAPTLASSWRRQLH
jgi:hypothetical protein